MNLTAKKKTILVIGTFDTKSDELRYLERTIGELGGQVLTMDVGVLGDPPHVVDIDKQAVAAAADSSIETAIGCDDENGAMQIMARGASRLCQRLYDEGRIDGLIAIGGTMGTDLALDCARALPIGVPKYVVSTVAFSPLIPPDRLSADLQMILWAGGLYGLNEICRATLRQAAGAVFGAALAARTPQSSRPVIGMTSLGSSCLSYMIHLKPALEERGFDVAIFHATGMGGMAYERIAAAGGFACVMDFALPEVGNYLFGSVVHSGDNRLLGAGRSNTPQLIAPGCIDLIDFAGWQDVPPKFVDRPSHAHNRLIKSSAYNEEERRETAREIGRRLAAGHGPTRVLLPLRGIEQWDRPGEAAHDPQGLAAFIEQMRHSIVAPCELIEVDAHINDEEFASAALAQLDAWIDDGTVSSNSPRTSTF